MKTNLAVAWLDVFHNQDISQLERILADDFVHTSPFGEIQGKQTYLDVVRQNAEAFFSKKIEIRDVIEDDAKSAIRYVVGEMEACDCVYIRNDQISKICAYYHFGDKPVM